MRRLFFNACLITAVFALADLLIPLFTEESLLMVTISVQLAFMGGYITSVLFCKLEIEKVKKAILKEHLNNMTAINLMLRRIKENIS